MNCAACGRVISHSALLRIGLRVRARDLDTPKDRADLHGRPFAISCRRNAARVERSRNTAMGRNAARFNFTDDRRDVLSEAMRAARYASAEFGAVDQEGSIMRVLLIAAVISAMFAGQAHATDRGSVPVLVAMALNDAWPCK